MAEPHPDPSRYEASLHDSLIEGVEKHVAGDAAVHPGLTGYQPQLGSEPESHILQGDSSSTSQRDEDRTKSQSSRGSPSGGSSLPTGPLSADPPHEAETMIAVNTDFDDFDDGYDSVSTSDSTSLASEARNFIFEHGRRYHSYRAGSYQFPNDDREQDREDLKHAMYLKLFRGILHFAPLQGDALNAIDLGTGTGIWAIDFADQNSSASVLGIDLSPIQTEWVPPNLKFMVDDAEAEWLYPPNHFDYVHTRHTVQAFRNWSQLMRRSYKHLKPGGYLELQEIDHFPRSDDASLTLDSPLCQYWSLITSALRNLGVDLRLAPLFSQMMRDAGFINVTERVFYTPIGPWAQRRDLREVGAYWRAVLLEGLEAIAYGPLTRGLGWQKEEVDVFLAGVRKAYMNKEVHSYMPFYIVYGQKPFTAED